MDFIEKLTDEQRQKAAEKGSQIGHLLNHIYSSEVHESSEDITTQKLNESAFCSVLVAYLYMVMVGDNRDLIEDAKKTICNSFDLIGQANDFFLKEE